MNFLGVGRCCCCKCPACPSMCSFAELHLTQQQYEVTTNSCGNCSWNWNVGTLSWDPVTNSCTCGTCEAPIAAPNGYQAQWDWNGSAWVANNAYMLGGGAAPLTPGLSVGAFYCPNPPFQGYNPPGPGPSGGIAGCGFVGTLTYCHPDPVPHCTTNLTAYGTYLLNKSALARPSEAIWDGGYPVPASGQVGAFPLYNFLLSCNQGNGYPFVFLKLFNSSGGEVANLAATSIVCDPLAITFRRVDLSDVCSELAGPPLNNYTDFTVTE